jgi:pimeloyl-ACP methyl ester carboxylesterase
MKVAFNDPSFAFEHVRNIGFTYYGGADIGEMMAIVPRIKEGDFESWGTEFDKLARRLLSRADACKAGGHLVSAREAYLRASSYFRAGEFYVDHASSAARALIMSHASEQAYAEAAKLFGPTWERVEIPYERTTMPGYFYKVDNSGKPRPTVIFHGGFDSSLEELYYFCAAAAIRRGYNCLTYDGPGQGSVIRDQHIPFRWDWEATVTPAVDWALKRREVDGNKLALMGMSLGGYLAARAVAFEHRFKAAVLFDGIYSFHECVRGAFPKEALVAFDAGDAAKADQITLHVMESVPGLRWSVRQGIWVCSASGPIDFLEKTKGTTMDGVVSQIRTPCLVMEGQGDMFCAGQPQKIYDALKGPKTYATFSAEDGAENHANPGNSPTRTRWCSTGWTTPWATEGVKLPLEPTSHRAAFRLGLLMVPDD